MLEGLPQNPFRDLPEIAQSLDDVLLKIFARATITSEDLRCLDGANFFEVELGMQGFIAPENSHYCLFFQDADGAVCRIEQGGQQLFPYKTSKHSGSPECRDWLKTKIDESEHHALSPALMQIVVGSIQRDQRRRLSETFFSRRILFGSRRRVA